MKKLFFMIFMFIIFSCEDISEEITNYTYLEYLEDGWEGFVYKSWEEGKITFNRALLQNSENYSEAYSGLGWIYLFEANYLQGEPNSDYRIALRDSSATYFNLAYEEGMFNENSWSDVLVGMAFLYNYKSDSLLSEYYNNIFIDESLWNLMEINASEAIDFTDELLLINTDYNFYPYIPLNNFEYDLCINKNTIRILRSQLFFKIKNYDNIYNELAELTEEYACPNGIPNNMQDAIYCISYVSNLLLECN